MNRNLFRSCTLIGAIGALGVLASCGENTVGPKSGMAPSGPSFTATEPFNGPGVCMANDAVAAPTGTIDGVKNGDNPLTATNCTSNDVAIATTTLVSYQLPDGQGGFTAPIPYNGGTVACNDGDPIKLNINARLEETANSARSDIGIWIATDGGNAITGACNHYNLVPGSGGVTNPDNDSCGDLDQGAVVPSFPLGVIDAICRTETPTDTLLHIGSCLGWKEPGADTACPLASEGATENGFRWGTLYANKSKCNCDGFDVPITVNRVAHLEVVKACTPSNDNGTFDLLIDGSNSFANNVSCGGTTGSREVGAGTNVNPGATHTFGEGDFTTANYTSSYSCVNRVGGASRGTGTSLGPNNITLQPGDDVICTYTNVRKATIVIVKDAVPNDAQDFAFTSDIAGNASFNLDDDGDNTLSNTQTINNVTPGTYSVTEGSTSGWDLTNISCTDPTTNSSGNTGTRVASINVAAGETVTCTFTNTKKGSIIIKKETNPDAVSGSFSFSQNIDGSGNFSLSDGGSVTFTNVTPNTAGGYTVTETVTAGFSLESLSCDNPDAANASTTSGAVATIRVNAGETVTCTYTNKQLATLELRKVEGGGLPLSRAWSFELRTGATTLVAGTVVASASANTTTGVVQFSGYFTPGSYQLCETGMPVGYTNNITGFTPGGAAPEGADNSTECINITLASGANGPGGITGVPNPINNTAPPPPGGDARTIGYWKNWSSCTGGKQYIKAGERNELNKTLDYYLPAGSALYPIGDIAGPITCDQAVRLLGKSDMNTGKKMASDPAYNLAAQFIAAKLNYAAGAGQCAAATTAIASAQTLLDAVNFTGTGSYKNMSPANATLANQLAATLDSYNNNTLCP